MRLPDGYQERIYTPQQARSVEAVWRHEEQCAGRSLILPDGRCDVIVRYNADPDVVPRLVVTGPATQPYWVEFETGDGWIGVRLRPERGGVLWGDALGGAKDQVALGDEAEDLVPELAGLGVVGVSEAELRQALVRFVEGRALSPEGHRVGETVRRMHLTGGRFSVTELAARAACSTRHLNRLFGGTVGLSVKTYAALVQFHRALRLVCDAGGSLSDAAFEAGYADQAHMTRAMRRFGGFVPSDIPEGLIRPDVSGGLWGNRAA
ncbi:MAG: helix-turn-helix transcriptional regulator [Shimia sp.]|nr:helix-turn-helix transcriptional regulator [Shimia sp.]